MSETGGLNESHQRRLLVNAEYADKLLSDIEAILNASESKSPFPKYRPDVSPASGTTCAVCLRPWASNMEERGLVRCTRFG